jgi:sugar phosphate isomerase/epimerase
MQFVLFTDNLADLTIAEACRGAKEAGFAGLDVTLRPGGHVKPEAAEVGLAEAVKIAEAAGLSIPMVTTAITEVASPHAEAIFGAAAHYGARRLKLGYWEYQPFGLLEAQVSDARRKLEGLIRLGEKYHVLPCVHCHSGRCLTANGQMLYLLLKGWKSSEVGAYVDPMHMTLEGGSAGWELGLDLVAPWIALAGIKNFRWVAAERDASGQQRYRWEYTPLADGQAPLPEFMTYLRRMGYDGTVSLHSEYKGGTSFRRLTTPELLRQSAEDLAYLRKLAAG